MILDGLKTKHTSAYDVSNGSRKIIVVAEGIPQESIGILRRVLFNPAGTIAKTLCNRFVSRGLNEELSSSIRRAMDDCKKMTSSEIKDICGYIVAGAIKRDGEVYYAYTSGGGIALFNNNGELSFINSKSDSPYLKLDEVTGIEFGQTRIQDRYSLFAFTDGLRPIIESGDFARVIQNAVRYQNPAKTIAAEKLDELKMLCKESKSKGALAYLVRD